MATIDPAGNRVHIRLTRAEKIFALRGDITIDPRHIIEAAVVPDGLAATKGLRAPGLGLPGKAKIGTWRRPGEVTVAIVTGKRPALRLRMNDGPVRSVLVTTEDPAADLHAIQSLRSGSAA